MRTKHLLTAMALPLFFAACANDELDVVSNDANVPEGRATVEGVVLSLGEGVEGRLAYNPTSQKYIWDETDQVGACLMDEITKDYGIHWSYDAYWAKSFTWVDYIQTNYLFNRDKNGNWTTESKMLEGNYFLHAPYNPNYGQRSAYSFECDDQTLENTTTAALLKAYAKNNAFVGYARVTRGHQEGETLADLGMVPVFGATGFTLENVGTKDYVISKIVLRGEKVSTYAVVDPTNAENLNKNGVGGSYNYYTDNTCMKGFNVANYEGNSSWSGWQSNTEANMAQYNGSYDKTKALKAVLNYKAGSKRVEVNIAAGNALKSKGSMNIIAMVAPAEIEEATDVYLDIHTDKGLIRNIKLGQKNNPENNGLVANSGSASTTVNLVTDKALTALAAGDKVKVEFDNTALDIPQVMDIYGSDEFAAFIHWNAGTSTDLTANLKCDVTISKEMATELIKSDISKITLNGQYNVTIEKDAPVATLDAFKYANNVAGIYVYGTQTLAENKLVKVYNYGVINVSADAVSATVYNYGTFNADATKLNTIVYNNGLMTVKEGKTILKAVTNSGTINNAGTIEILTNKYNGTVNNTGVLGKYVENVSILENGTVTNEQYKTTYKTYRGTINNNVEGIIYMKENKGNVYANDNSKTLVWTNEDGNIIITNLDEDEGNIIAATVGNVVQEISENKTTNDIDVRANMIWLSSTLTMVDDVDKDGKYLDVNLTNRADNGHVCITAIGKNARINGTGHAKLIMSDITVEADAALVVNKIDIEMYNDDVENCYVTMNGYNNHIANLTVNSNASLIAGDNKDVCVVYTYGAAYNKVYNLSSSTQLGFYDAIEGDSY